ncbi:MAG: hypothetical protein P4L49_20790 [Desulfosporosinus sp.]|nr:hypothetical protein [Desulfosporosinus sp.]
MEKNQESIEIVNVDQLKAVKREDKGYVVIKDTVRNTLRRPGCENVNVVHFWEKVLDNGRKDGNYFRVDTVETARTLFKAKFCDNCQ